MQAAPLQGELSRRNNLYENRLTQKPIKMIKDSIHYSAEFKNNLVSEVLSGKLSKDEAKRVYGIRGNSTVLKWIRKFEKEDILSVSMTK